MSVVLDPLLDWAENEWESLTPQERQEMEKEAEEEGVEAQIFLPFPFTTKEVKQPPYRGSDPEWKQFVSLSRDETKQKEIRREKCSMYDREMKLTAHLQINSLKCFENESSRIQILPVRWEAR
jgi:hypothetical protein